VSSSALAQVCDDTNCPSTFQIESRPIASVPTRFKFQTRISQGKIPVGDAEFSEITVNLRDGNTVVCQEKHTNVRVRDSVLNLDIGGSWGAGGNCQLDDIIAESSGLNFQICIGNSSNCLEPVALSSVPFAVKSNFAAQSQEAHKADVAAQCHYAHRVTADTSLFVTERVGAGYYDFHTPTAMDALAINAQSVNGGFIQWTPVNPEHGTLHLCKKDNLTNELVPLSELMFHAAQTIARGDMSVDGGLWVDGADGANVSASLTVGQSATISVDTTVGRDLSVGGNATVTQRLDVVGATGLGSTLDVAGPSTLLSTMSVAGQSTLSGGAMILNEGGPAAEPSLTVTGLSRLHGNVDAQGDMSVSGNFTGGGNATVDGALSVEGDASLQSNAVVGGSLQCSTLDVGEGALTVNGAGLVTVGDGGARVTGATDLRNLDVWGATNFHGPVNLPPDVATQISLADDTIRSNHIVDGQVQNADTAIGWSLYAYTQTSSTPTDRTVQARVCFLSFYQPDAFNQLTQCQAFPGVAASVNAVPPIVANLPSVTALDGARQTWTLRMRGAITCGFSCMN
jgi:carbonic anhydrase/acetyltransferase-like protein (isoleucine patch superfamily)